MLVLLPHIAENPKIAFVAQYYYPYPDKRNSKARVYVCDWNGKNRRTLSLPGQSCSSVVWAGRNRIVYSVPLSKLLDGREIWTVKLNGGKPVRLIERSHFIDSEIAFEMAPDGYPIISNGYPDFSNNKNQKLLTVGPKFGRLQPAKTRKNPWFGPWETGLGQIDEGSNWRIRSLNPKAPGSITFSDLPGLFNLQVEGKATTKEFHHLIWNPSSNQLWLYENWGRGDRRFWRVNWKTGAFKELFLGGAWDWRPDRKKFAFVTPMDLGNYGPKKKLWITELWVGDLTNDATHRLFGGTALYGTVAVQPSPNSAK